MNVRVRLPVPMRRDPSQVERVRLAVNRGAEGIALVPLGEVAVYSLSDTPSGINRQALTREVVLSANLDGLPLGEAMNKVKAVADTMPMAPGYRKVGVSQPLYSSGAVAAGIRAAGKGLATADDRLRIARHAVLRDVYSAFHDILLGRELNRIATEDRAQKARHLDEARKKYAAGTATDYDILAAEVALRNTEPAVVRTENSIRTVRERLRFLLGRDRSEVDAKGDLSAVVVEPPEYGKSLETAVEHRPELSDLRHRQGVAQELLVIARTGNRPRLDFRGALGRQEIDFGVDDIGGKTWSAGVFATWPLFDGLRTR